MPQNFYKPRNNNMSQNIENMIDVTPLFYPDVLFPEGPGNTPLNIKEIRKAFDQCVEDNSDFNDKEYCFVEHLTDYDDTRVYFTTSKPAEICIKPLVETAGKFYPSYIKQKKIFEHQESDLLITLHAISEQQPNTVSFSSLGLKHES